MDNIDVDENLKKQLTQSFHQTADFMRNSER
jgi:hypothetical protein